MKREYKDNGASDSLLDTLSEYGVRFYAPLSEGDLTDHVNGVTPILVNGTVAWSSAMGAYNFITTASSPPLSQYGRLSERGLRGQGVLVGVVQRLLQELSHLFPGIITIRY